MYYYYKDNQYVGCGNESVFSDCEVRTVPPEPAPKTNDEIIADIANEVQARLDSFALTRNYDNVNSISKYQNITDEEIAFLPVEDQAMVTQFRAECRYLALATAQTWAKLYAVLSQVDAGNRVVASYEDVESDLPELVWP